MANNNKDRFRYMDINEDDNSMVDQENWQLSSDEMAAVLADTYYDEALIGSFDDEESIRVDEREERAYSARRRQKMQEMRRRKKQQERMRRLMIPCAVVLVIVLFMAVKIIGNLAGHHARQSETAYNSSFSLAGCYVDSTIADVINDEIAHISTLVVRTLGGKNNNPPLYATADATTVSPDSEVVSENGIFIDVEAGKILGQRDAKARISPASMTKILTVLVAAEHITDLDDTFEITLDITDYSYVNHCSNTGFDVGEKVTVKDLFYGTILPSGADAALGLAVYVAGSQEAFVDLMNEKIEELGLSKTTHFTNCVGLYDDDHYSTVYDMAVILKAACDNSFCREVLSAHTYKTSVTGQHPDGITISNWFLRKIEDKDTHGEVLCAKTGFVVQSGNCAASLSVGNDGKEYICVTAHSVSSWR
ncbi:MAG: hypothetical protein K2M91_03040, partial [Lachnospiraceae bacterium]|nr:hypothetical protein [Lachnospiraceae bacterium]